MSLVGSLEDLGLGEILQIVSLSGKSGVLWIRSPFGEGHILFDRGAIRGAQLEGGPRDLAALVAECGALPEGEVEALAADARSAGATLEEVLVARTSLDAGRIDELRERHVEATVLRMFSWPLGEFNFEIREETAGGAEDLRLRAGINAQFLALEGARMRDENAHEHGAGDAPDAGEALFSGEEPAEGSGDSVAAAAPADTALEAIVEPPDESAELEIAVLELLEDEGGVSLPATLELDEPISSTDEDPTLSGEAHHAIVSEALVASEPPPPSVEAPDAPAPETRGPVCSGVVLIDPELGLLEWAKHAMAPLGLRTHIFPRAELGIQRIRQYFARGEMPLVVLTSETPADAVSGARDWAEIAARLRAQVPQLPIVLIATPGTKIVPTSERGVPDAVATRPRATVIADERARERREALALELREAITTARRRPQPTRSSAAPGAAEPMRVLREWTTRLRDASPPSDVLRLVLEFAGRHFERAVVFWVREGEAHAVAQRGCAAPGSPEDAALAKLSAGAESLVALRKVFEGRAPVRAMPSGADDAFFARLGAATPAELYVAPIESGDQIAALLYADNAPSGRPLGDTGTIEVILHEAGLALDRAVLERALEQVEKRGARP